MYLLSSHLGCSIQQYCDEVGYDHYTTLVEPVLGNVTVKTIIHLKWVKADGASVPNHVVPLLPKGVYPCIIAPTNIRLFPS